MTSPDRTPRKAPLDASGALLDEVRASRAREHAEQVLQLRLAVEYARLNPPASAAEAASLPGSEGELQLAGPGAPGIAEFAVVEYAAALGMSTDAGRLLLGHALEITHRLPQVHALVMAGELPVWRARRIADHTVSLCVEGAAWVDTQIAPVAATAGVRRLERLVEEALVRFDPEEAAMQAADALETRHVNVTRGACVSYLDGVLDTGDALDLDTALAELAAEMAAAGDTDPLDVRRAKALGLLARREGVEGVEPRRREVVLHVHLTDQALRGAGDGFGVHHSATGRPYGPVTVEQVQDWCGNPDASVTVKPVLDLNETLVSSGYEPSDRLRAQVVAMNPTCVFPYCERPSARLDLDHIHEHADGGPTATDNLAPLCRRHHRTKTFTTWTYQRLSRGRYEWSSPHGHRYRTDPDGTTDLTDGLADTG